RRPGALLLRCVRLSPDERRADPSAVARRLAALDDLDAVVVRVADEAEARAALAHRVRRPLGFDALFAEAGQRAVEILDADRDVAVAGAELVGAPVVVVRQLEDVLLVADREEVVRRFQLERRTRGARR